MKKTTIPHILNELSFNFCHFTNEIFQTLLSQCECRSSGAEENFDCVLVDGVSQLLRLLLPCCCHHLQNLSENGKKKWVSVGNICERKVLKCSSMSAQIAESKGADMM